MRNTIRKHKRDIASIVGIIGALFGIILGPIFVIEYTNRAIIYYHMDAYDGVNFNYETYLSVILKFRNSGKTDCAVYAYVTTINAIISNYTIKYPNTLLSDTQARFHYYAHKERQQYSEIQVHIYLNDSPENFTINYYIEESNPPLIPFFRAELKPADPTQLTYEHVDELWYCKATRS